jgi:hypothetical protein
MFPALRAADQTQRTRDFVALAKIWAEAKGSVSNARLIQESRPHNPRVEAILQKAEPGSLGHIGSPGNWGEDLADYATVAEGFAASLRHVGVFDRMLPSMRVVPLKTARGQRRQDFGD